ncbi:hypothetical protein D3C73_1561350 [compost metagenome]
MAAHRIQEGFAVQFVAELLSVHVPGMGGIPFDFDHEFHIPRYPGEIRKIGPAPPIGNLILRVEMF